MPSNNNLKHTCLKTSCFLEVKTKAQASKEYKVRHGVQMLVQQKTRQSKLLTADETDPLTLKNMMTVNVGSTSHTNSTIPKET